MGHKKLSIVIPLYKETQGDWLQKILKNIPKDQRIQTLVCGDKETRAARLNEGIAKAQGELILLHHPRSLLPSEAYNYLLENSSNLTWGGFTHRFDQDSVGLKFTSWYSNQVRAKLFSILYLDHCIFFQKKLLDRPCPEVEIFEDTEISKILRSFGAAQILNFNSTTSAIRFEKNGFLKQGLMNQFLKLCYFFNVSPQKMNKIYEKGLGLNG